MANTIAKLERDLRRISSRVLNEVVTDLQTNKELEKTVKNEVERGLNSTSVLGEFQGNGDLTGELGLEDPVGKYQRMVDYIKENEVELTVQGRGSRRLRLNLGIIDETHSNIIGEEFARQANTHSRIGLRPILNWLEWLLLRGKSTIISDFDAVRRGASRGRAGLGYRMEPRAGSAWSVPDGHDGVQGNNFITRALDARRPSLVKAFRRIVNLTVNRVARRNR